MLKKLFKKKEKPALEYTKFEICTKTFYADDYTYMPTNVAYFEDRIEFVIDRIDHQEEGDNKIETFKASAAITGERHLPLEVDGTPLLWDTKDLAFRRKLQPEGEPIALIPGVLLYPNEVMTMDRAFAEEQLSPQALSYADLREDTYIWYYPDGSASPAVFEMPRLFFNFDENAHHPLSGKPMGIRNHTITFTPSYLADMGITRENIKARYIENIKKGATPGAPDPLEEFIQSL